MRCGPGAPAERAPVGAHGLAGPGPHTPGGLPSRARGWEPLLGPADPSLDLRRFGRRDAVKDRRVGRRRGPPVPGASRHPRTCLSHLGQASWSLPNRVGDRDRPDSARHAPRRALGRGRRSQSNACFQARNTKAASVPRGPRPVPRARPRKCVGRGSNPGLHGHRVRAGRVSWTVTATTVPRRRRLAAMAMRPTGASGVRSARPAAGWSSVFDAGEGAGANRAWDAP
jgi:hypothetical protein